MRWYPVRFFGRGNNVDTLLNVQAESKKAVEQGVKLYKKAQAIKQKVEIDEPFDDPSEVTTGQFVTADNLPKLDRFMNDAADLYEVPEGMERFTVEVVLEKRCDVQLTAVSLEHAQNQIHEALMTAEGYDLDLITHENAISTLDYLRDDIVVHPGAYIENFLPKD